MDLGGRLRYSGCPHSQLQCLAASRYGSVVRSVQFLCRFKWMMCRRILCLLLGTSLATSIVGSSGCGAGNRPRPIRLKRELEPLLLSSNDSAPVAIGEALDFVNPSRTSSLSLRLRRRSCNCTNFEVKPEVIAPGEKGQIALRTTVPRMTSNQHFWIVFDTNTPEVPSVEVNLLVRTVLRLQVEPPEFPEMRIPVGGEANIEFKTIVSAALDDLPEPVTVAVSSSALIEKRDAPSPIDGDGVRKSTARWVATLRCAPDAAPGAHEDVLTVTAGRDSVQALVRWRPLYPVQADPERIFLANGTAESGRRTVDLRADRPFQIIGTSVDSKFVQIAPQTDGSRPAHRLIVSLQPASALPRCVKANITIVTDVPNSHTDTTSVMVTAMAFNTNVSDSRTDDGDAVVPVAEPTDGTAPPRSESGTALDK